MNIRREGGDYIITMGNLRITCEGMGALLTLFGVPLLMLLFMLAVIF